MTTVHETEVDGVRCFWVDTGRPTLAASLLFRQGMCDEPLVESGWLHMLEHLALHGRGGGALHVNGSVSLLQTSFDAHGPAEAVASHLSEVSGWLADPKFEEFEKERGVLRAEAAGRGGAMVRALGWRYGARGPGVATYSEPGISRATPDQLAARAQRVFTQGNSVLVLDGPPPAGLSLKLPAGEFLRAPTAVPCDDILPAAYQEESGLVISGLVARSTAATIFPDMLHRMLREQFRDKDGAAYAPWATYEAVDADTAVIVAGSDVDESVRQQLVWTVKQKLRHIVDFGVTASDLDESIASITQSIADPYAAYGLAFRAGSAVLNGREPETFDEIIAEYRALTPDSLDETSASFSSTLIMGIPSESSVGGQLHQLGQIVGARKPGGNRFRHQDWPATRLELVVDEGSAQVVGVTAVHRSVEFTDVEAVFSYPDGARDLIERDGWVFGIEPSMWKDGAKAVGLIDAAIPGDAQLEQPPRQNVATPARMPLWRRWFRGHKGHLVWAGYFVLLALLIGVFIAGFVNRQGPSPVLAGVWAGFLVRHMIKVRDRSR